ncbi:MAG: cyclic nucleotide-binding domain-containing protein, partial [Elioraea tepidiphila]
IWAGDRMEFVGSVVTGIATLTQTMEDGRRQMVGLLLPSDFVGRPGRPVAAFDVTATTDLVMCCFRKKPFEDLMATTPHIAQRLLEMTLDELDAAREWMLLLGRKTARDGGATALAIAAQVQATEAALAASGTEAARAVQARLQAARAAYEEVVRFIAAQAKADPVATYAGSVPYLMLAGNLMAGWQ